MKQHQIILTTVLLCLWSALETVFYISTSHNTSHIRGGSTGNTLDLIMSNGEGMVGNVEHNATLGKSDHMVLEFNFQAYTEKSSRPIHKYIYDKGDYESVRSELADFNWTETYTHGCTRSLASV